MTWTGKTETPDTKYPADKTWVWNREAVGATLDRIDSVQSARGHLQVVQHVFNGIYLALLHMRLLGLKIDLKRNLLNYECLILPLCRKDGQREKLVERHVDSSLFCGFIIQAKQRYQNGNP